MINEIRDIISIISKHLIECFDKERFKYVRTYTLDMQDYAIAIYEHKTAVVVIHFLFDYTILADHNPLKYVELTYYEYCNPDYIATLETDMLNAIALYDKGNENVRS